MWMWITVYKLVNGVPSSRLVWAKCNIKLPQANEDRKKISWENYLKKLGRIIESCTRQIIPLSNNKVPSWTANCLKENAHLNKKESIIWDWIGRNLPFCIVNNSI
jgi:hypothetical protein